MSDFDDAFQSWNVPAVINACGPVTRLGGAPQPAEVVDAMARAAAAPVSIEQLQAAASREIALATGAEAGLVTAGAAAALTLGAAAILAGDNLRRMERLPHLGDDDACEMLVARDQRSGYDHAVRAAGARLVEVGFNEVVAGAGVRRTEVWEYEAAITSRTAGVLYVADDSARPALPELVQLARRRHLPLLVDAAGQLPPRENLRRFIDLGADLAVFSGGKAMRGPQETGILCGRRPLIASAALQMLDMDDHFALWAPDHDWIDQGELPGMPRHGIGRGLKVSKEGIVGLLTALRLFQSGAYDADLPRMRAQLEEIVAGLAGLPVECQLHSPDDGESPPRLTIAVNAAGTTAMEICRQLRTPGADGEPPVYLGHGELDQNRLSVHPLCLTPDAAAVIVRRLRALL